jgi:hypothetical protein
MSYARLCPARRRTRIRLPKHRAPIRQAPVENGLPRDGQTVFRLYGFCLAPISFLWDMPGYNPPHSHLIELRPVQPLS